MIKLDGKAVAAKCKEDIRARVEALKEQGCKPGLAVILVGDNPASRVYVSNKEKDCAECGIYSEEYKLPEDVQEQELLELIRTLNNSPSVHGILVQLPLPAHLSEELVIGSIAPEKDVDAFHPFNVGRIMQGKPLFAPCTPAGVMKLLDEYGIDPAGKRCVVVGRSNIVGKPMAMLLLQRNGTVTICHSKTADLKGVCLEADILVCAVGRRGLITGDMVKPGAVVVDVAMNRNDEGKLCGDCVYDEVAEKASYLTPVPGGVGPMTRVMLLENTLTAAQRAFADKK
jgi:methylenetetrahydrofolate dehydrogenase (NADP+)/methenyltetrahydrofolate cyclohydrolase